jgi:hypothetical protein
MNAQSKQGDELNMLVTPLRRGDHDAASESGDESLSPLAIENAWSPEEYAKIACKVHFPHADAVDLHVRKNKDGEVLFSTIVEAKRKVGKEGRLSSTFWSGLTSRFECICDPFAKLMVLDADMAFAPALRAALASFLHPNPAQRSDALLLGWMDTTQSCNQKEFIALLRGLRHQKVTVAPRAIQLFINVFKMLVRLQMLNAFKKDVDSIRSMLDHALAAHLSVMRGDHVSGESFFAGHKEVAAFVCNEDQMEWLLAKLKEISRTECSRLLLHQYPHAVPLDAVPLDVRGHDSPGMV